MSTQLQLQTFPAIDLSVIEQICEFALWMKALPVPPLAEVSADIRTLRLPFESSMPITHPRTARTPRPLAAGTPLQQ
jgi:hypothetical protein